LTSDRAWGWLAHLRAGGSTPWPAWEGTGEPAGRLPGAQQLELVRRLNALSPLGADLIDRILTTGGPGRGHQDLALVGDSTDGKAPEFGPAPVDPTQLPADELVRLASGVLADLVVDRATPAPADPRPRLLRPRYLLRGDPWLTRAARVQLRSLGLPPGGRRGRALVVVSPLDVYCADLWAAISAHSTVPRWSTWLTRLDEQLPPRVDPVLQAARAADRVGRGRVHLCVGLDAVGELLDAPVETPARLSHAALDAMRQVRGVLRVTVGEPGARALVGSTLIPWLGAADNPKLPRPGVPRSRLPWLRAEARRWQSELGAAGYAVHGGGLDELMPADPVRTLPPTDEEIVHVMLRTLQWAAGEGGRTL
jgi:hypothetical protein